MIRAALSRLRRSSDGAAAVEFVLVSPLLIALIFGVTQVGIWMNSYNSLRSAVNDTGRFVTVEFQKGNPNGLTNIDIAVEARNRAMAAPYDLSGAGLSTYVSDAPTQSINHVTEKTLKIVYQMPSVMPIGGVDSFKVSYTRSLFVKSGV